MWPVVAISNNKWQVAHTWPHLTSWLHLWGHTKKRNLNKQCWLMLCQRRRRWPSIKSALVRCLVFGGIHTWCEHARPSMTPRAKQTTRGQSSTHYPYCGDVMSWMTSPAHAQKPVTCGLLPWRNVTGSCGRDIWMCHRFVNGPLYPGSLWFPVASGNLLYQIIIIDNFAFCILNKWL